MAATTNERVTDGPAFWPAAAAVRTKMPAPMTAPIPNAINPGHFRTRLSPPFSSTWASNVESGFVRNRLIVRLLEDIKVRRGNCPKHRSLTMDNAQDENRCQY